MKKILAGVLAAASLMAMTVSASATSNDKAVTKTGELTYDVAVAAPKITLNLVMPAKMTAALNPYGASIEVIKGVESTKGIASVAYKVTNKSKDYGVFIDATAITTITTSDKDSDGVATWTVKGTSVTAGTKGACLSLVALKEEPTTSTAVATASAAWSKAAKKGALEMDSTVAADADKGIAKGQTTMKKMAYVAANDGTADGVAYLLFAGELAGDDTTNKKEVVWNEDDAINVNLVLKVNAAAKADPTT